MQPLKAHVKDGRLVLDDARSSPSGARPASARRSCSAGAVSAGAMARVQAIVGAARHGARDHLQRAAFVRRVSIA